MGLIIMYTKGSSHNTDYRQFLI